MYKSSNIPMSTSTYELVHADAIPCDMILLNLRAIIIPKHSPGKWYPGNEICMNAVCNISQH